MFCFLSFSPQWDWASVSHHLRKPVIISPSLRFGSGCGLALSSKGRSTLHELSVCPASKEQLPRGQEPVFCWDTASARVLAWVDASECFRGIRFTTMTAALQKGKYTGCLMGWEEPKHWEIRWLGLCLSHQRSWGHTMGTLSWIYLHLIPHGNRWAEHVWEHPLSGRFIEVSGVGKCIHLCLGVCEPSRENKNPYVSSVGRCCLILSYNFVISSQQFSWWDALTANVQGFKASGPERCGFLDLYHHSLISQHSRSGNLFFPPAYSWKLNLVLWHKAWISPCVAATLLPSACQGNNWSVLKWKHSWLILPTQHPLVSSSWLLCTYGLISVTT